MLERVIRQLDEVLTSEVYGWGKEHPLNRRETINQILSIKVYKDYTIKDLIERGLIVADDQSLPEIPEFQYDEEDKRKWLKRGAINYSKMLSNWRKVIPKEGE